jgi:hypothetical protein
MSDWYSTDYTTDNLIGSHVDVTPDPDLQAKAADVLGGGNPQSTRYADLVEV